MKAEIRVGDCREVMAAMEENSIEAIVTDPPYGLEFMGKEWDKLDGGLPQENVWRGRRGKGGSSIGTDDSKPASRHHVSLGAGKQHGFPRCQTCGKRQFSGSPCVCKNPDFVLEYRQSAPSSSIRMQRWHEAWAIAAYRVARPGAHLLAFGGTRTFHRLTCAIEDAGWEIRDCLMWLYGSGFPKSLDVSKAIDRAAGAERIDGAREWSGGARRGGILGQNLGTQTRTICDSPATDAAKQWTGFGTALKPAWEPIVLARKPLIGTVAANVQTHGTGAINVDACRIGTERTHATRNTALGRMNDDGWQARPQVHDAIGRWPANVALDEDAARQLDEQSGETVSGTAIRRNLPDEGGSQKINFKARTARGGDVTFGDSGGASRFFYTSKASQTDRDRDMGNRHPTVKPVDLMRWLVRLVTPPGGTVLDPFAGSGSTGVAALGEGFNFIGIELDAEYAAIAKARLESVAPMFAEVTAR